MSKRELANLNDALSRQFVPRRKTRNAAGVDGQELRTNETRHEEHQNHSRDHANIYGSEEINEMRAIIESEHANIYDLEDETEEQNSDLFEKKGIPSGVE